MTAQVATAFYLLEALAFQQITYGRGLIEAMFQQ